MKNYRNSIPVSNLTTGIGCFLALFYLVSPVFLYGTGVPACNYSLDYISQRASSTPASLPIKGVCWVFGSPTLIPQAAALFISGVLDK